MFIREFEAVNYRTLENIKITFNGYYAAISGKNNAGKSNVLRAIRTILYSDLHFRIKGNSIMGLSNFDLNEEITSWKIDSKEDVQISATLEVCDDVDTEIYKYITDFIIQGTDIETKTIGRVVKLKISFIKKFTNEEQYVVAINDDKLEDEYKTKELVKRFQSAECLAFHNSTMNTYGPFGDSMDRMRDYIIPSDSDKISKKKDELLTLIRRSLRSHQQQLTGWLGKLEDKYEVSLSVQGLNFEREPIDISLKEKGGDVMLENWGSGTRNRTLIFLKLFNAVKRARSESKTERIMPIIIIEEPESFLHPQAQAEFGRVLQDMAEELKIQIITTTHSPYFLSVKSPTDNILLERAKSKNNPCTSVVSSNNENWWEPFVEALGINGSDFGPMKELIFSDNSKILLVEGYIDKEYMTFLQNDIHGKNALSRDIEIYPYEGADNIRNNILMNFIRKKFKKVVVTVDLDRFNSVKKAVTSVGFKENVDFISVGVDEPGKQCIEGLVPKSLYGKVYTEDLDLTQKAMMAVGDEQKSAKNELKKKLIEAFKQMPISDESHKLFYELTRKINKAFK